MELVVINHLSLDGVMQSPGQPDEDPTRFPYGGWLVPYPDEAMGPAGINVVGGSGRFASGPQDL